MKGYESFFKTAMMMKHKLENKLKNEKPIQFIIRKKLLIPKEGNTFQTKTKKKKRIDRIKSVQLHQSGRR